MTKTTEKLDQETIEGIQPYSGELVQLPQAVPTVPVQRVQTQYTTAISVQKPRNLDHIVARVLDEASRAGGLFFYYWEVWNKRLKRMDPIEGPSIHLEMCIARNYGNCGVDIQVTEDPGHWMFRAVFIDLETGFNLTRLFRQHRNTNMGKMDDNRAQDVLFQSGQSKAQRNVVNKAVPGWLVAKAIETAKDAELKGIKKENPVFARAKVIEFFSRYGVDAEAVEKKLDRKSVNWDPEDILKLRSFAAAIKDGRVTAREIFDEPEKKEADPATDKRDTSLDRQHEKNIDAMNTKTKPPPDETVGGKITPAASGQDGKVDVGASTGKEPDQGKETEKVPQAPAKLREETGESKTEAWQRDRWINRKSGFQDYVVANIKDLRLETVEIQLAVQDKWRRLKIKFPSFDHVLTGQEPKPVTGEPENPEGADRGEGENVPGTAPDGAGIPEEVGDKTEPPEMTEQEALKDLAWHQAKHPDYYNQALAPEAVGICPVDDARGWAIDMLDAIKAKVEFDQGGTFID